MKWLKEIPNETEEQLLFRAAEFKKIHKISWEDIAPDLNELTGLSNGESSWRKKYKNLKQLKSGEVSAVSNNKEETPGNLKDLEKITGTQEEIRELDRKIIQLRDERNAWRKQNYAEARLCETLNLLEKEISSIANVGFPIIFQPFSMGAVTKEMIICLSDWHLGQDFANHFGKYNSDIARIRLGILLKKVLEVSNTFNICNIHIVCMGDMISGNIHKTVAITNKENVIDQIKMATDLLSNFCYECCKQFASVNLYSVVGNHSRIDRKDDALHDERLDDIISWATSLYLHNAENFHYEKNSYDTGIAELTVLGKKYLAVHGDYDALSKNSINNLSMMIGYIPYAILKGHNHSPAYEEYNNIKVIQSGALSGCGDDYTIEKRLCGKPSQTIMVCNDKGLDCIFNVEFCESD